jgi:hypothetical protein
MAAAGGKSTASQIRQIRLGLGICAGLFTLWWIIEFATYAGRTSGFDAFDFLFVLLAGAIGWLLYQAWQARCPQCGNPFFLNSSLPSWVNLSSQCPYCGANLSDVEEHG